jgi:hypothetical protein
VLLFPHTLLKQKLQFTQDYNNPQYFRKFAIEFKLLSISDIYKLHQQLKHQVDMSFESFQTYVECSFDNPNCKQIDLNNLHEIVFNSIIDDLKQRWDEVSSEKKWDELKKKLLSNGNVTFIDVNTQKNN